MIARPARLGLAASAGLVAATGLYAVLRVVQLLTGPEPNPATVIWSMHSGFLWRSATTLYAGGMVACIAYVLAGRAPGRVARALVLAVVVAAALLVAQAALAP